MCICTQKYLQSQPLGEKSSCLTPFQPLQSALRALIENAQILPATGQAVMDIGHADLEEIYDQRTTGDATIQTHLEQ